MMITIPKDMDIPESRRDTTKLENLRWLERNLAIRNRKHADFYIIIDAIRTEVAKRDKRS